MFSNPKNKGKLISFIIALSLFLVSNLVQRNLNKKKDTIGGLLAKTEKQQEQFLKNVLLAQNQFSQGQLYITMGMMTVDAMHPIDNIILPIEQCMTQGLDLMNLTTGAQLQESYSRSISDVKDAFSTARQSTGDIATPFAKAVTLFNEMSKSSTAYEETLNEQKATYLHDREIISQSSNTILWINTLILLVQLFFSAFYDIYVDYKAASKAKLSIPN